MTSIKFNVSYIQKTYRFDNSLYVTLVTNIRFEWMIKKKYVSKEKLALKIDVISLQVKKMTSKESTI